MKDGDRIAFKYIENPNGALEDIAGILSENHRVLGMMPHPERHTENVHGCQDGFPFFEGCFNLIKLLNRLTVLSHIAVMDPINSDNDLDSLENSRSRNPIRARVFYLAYLFYLWFC